MPGNLIIFTLGPIQDFIASARRSRDLRYGSWLLSDLARTAARTVADRHGLDALIFPKPASREELEIESRLGIANKIVAIVPGSRQSLAELAQEVETAVRARLDSLAAKAFDKIGDQKLDDRASASRQVADLLEFYWVAQPLAQGDDDYPKVRRTLEALTAARKATRDFRQLPGRPGYAKSSLDGMRESVVPKHRYPISRDYPEVWRNKALDLYRIYGAGPAEQLSGVDLLKRQGSAGEHFPSTSHFAALPFLKRLKTATTLPQLAPFLAALAEYEVRPDRTYTNLPYAPLGDCDGSLLFAARLTEEIKDEQEKREIADLLAAFLQEIAGDARPQPYYALLRADGDRMGATIDALDDKRQHQAISAALNRFAGQVAGLVEAHEGVAVYSGGDDVLAFLPLHTALACAEGLAAAFERELKPFANNQGVSPTLSTGIAITHHLEPLSDALGLAGAAEHAAKQVKDKQGREKHGLAVIVSKRSGAVRVVAGPRLEMAERLGQLMQLHRQQDAIPAGAAYQIQDMLVRLGGAPGDGAALHFEARRILQHKPWLAAGAAAAEAPPLLGRLLAHAEVTPAELVNEMIVAKFFADAQALAEGK